MSDTQKDIRSLGENYCFACGENNPIGLHLDFKIVDDKFVAKKTVPREYQSYPGIVHGGIVSTMLDEAMGGFIVARGEKAVTAKMELKYRNPTPLDTELTITGWEESRRRNIVSTKGMITLEDGTVTAEANATMIIVKE